MRVNILFVLIIFCLTTCVFAAGYTEGVPLDSFPGLTDDAKLTAALQEVVRYGNIVPILLTNRTYFFSTTRILFSGFKLMGPPNPLFAYSRGSINSCRVNLNVGNGNNSWLFANTTYTLYNILISNIGFYTDNNNAQFLHSLGDIQGSTFNSLGFYSFKHVFGNNNQRVSLIRTSFTGQWAVQAVGNITSTQFHLGGAENELWTGGFLDINFATLTAPATYMLHFDGMKQTNVGPIDLTINSAASGILIQGTSTTASGLTFTGARLQGNNPFTAANGALLVQQGGKVIYRNIWLAYGMLNATTTNHTPVDEAVVMHLGGEALWDGTTYDRARFVQESVPLFYTNAGKLRIFNTFTAVNGNQEWVGLPRVKRVNNVPLAIDDTITVVV